MQYKHMEIKLSNCWCNMYKVLYQLSTTWSYPIASSLFFLRVERYYKANIGMIFQLTHMHDIKANSSLIPWHAPHRQEPDEPLQLLRKKYIKFTG